MHVDISSTQDTCSYDVCHVAAGVICPLVTQIVLLKNGGMANVTVCAPGVVGVTCKSSCYLELNTVTNSFGLIKRTCQANGQWTPKDTADC